MIAKEFTTISAADIQTLLTNEIAEGRTLEYKEALPKPSDEEKREFLADVSSFANTAGGDLIYGIEEKRDQNGKPTGLVASFKGINEENPDATLLRLEAIIRDGLAPRLQVHLRSLDVSGKTLVIVRIPRSWAGPHMVTFKNSSRFFARSSAGKVQMDVDEIRASFFASDNQRERLEKTRNERILKILSDQTPTRMVPGPKIILHILPLSSSRVGASVDLTGAMVERMNLHALNAGSIMGRINFDGIIGIYGSGPSGALGYIQLFRSGVIEAVDSSLFESPAYKGKKQIPSTLFERGIIDACKSNLGRLSNLQLSPPYIISILIHDVKGFDLLSASRMQSYFAKVPYDRESLQLPEVLFENETTNLTSLLRPAFDALWQGAGLPGSGNYDPEGNWIGE